MALLQNRSFLIGLGLWQLIVLFTPISLYGFWTDVVVFIAWLLLLTYLGIEGRLRPRFLNLIGLGLMIVGLSLSFLTIGTLGGLFLAVELAQTRSVPQEEKRQGAWLLNQYFIPTGAYGCGMGKLITAKAPIFFPLVEYRTEYDPCVLDDFGCYIERGSWEACGY